MSARYKPSFWDIAIGVLAVLLVITLAGGPRRLPPDWTVQQTWSMHYEGPDGKPLTTNFIFQTYKARQKFGPYMHEHHWFGAPTIDMPVMPGTQTPPETPMPPGKQHRLSGTYVE